MIKAGNMLEALLDKLGALPIDCGLQQMMIDLHEDTVYVHILWADGLEVEDELAYCDTYGSWEPIHNTKPHITDKQGASIFDGQQAEHFLSFISSMPTKADVYEYSVNLMTNGDIEFKIETDGFGGYHALIEQTETGTKEKECYKFSFVD